MAFKIKARITPEHIHNGVASSCCECPLALALEPFSDNDEGNNAVKVGASFAAVKVSGQWYEAKLPPQLAQFVEEFDADTRDPPAPRNFTLKFTPLQESRALGSLPTPPG